MSDTSRIDAHAHEIDALRSRVLELERIVAALPDYPQVAAPVAAVAPSDDHARICAESGLHYVPSQCIPRPA